MKKTDDLPKKGNTALHKASSAKNDEFYTRRESIEAELQYYHMHFSGKVVYCNCDDPTVSEFYQYFKRNFELLKLKRLITTCYKSKDAFGWTKYKDENGLRIDYDGKKVQRKKLIKDGDFSSLECVSFLQEADIVVTNPPFSLFRKYVAQLVAEDKKFLILGNINAVCYKEIFQLIYGGKLWVGHKSMGSDMLFDVPFYFAEWLRANKKEGSGYKIVDGEVKGRSSAIWFTNLSHEKRDEYFRLGARYRGNESDYSKYENYNAINVNFVANIPCDYAGVMGVPITFLDKYNPDQFEIVGLGIAGLGKEIGVKPYKEQHRKYRKEVQKRGAVDGDLYMMIDGIVTVPYARMLIQNKKPQKRKG